MEHKHTPAPWSVNGGDDVWIGNRICVHVGYEDDARLIAAAPDLLEALQGALAQCLAWQGEPNEYSCDIHKAVVGQARAAIAKATGEPQWPQNQC